MIRLPLDKQAGRRRASNGCKSEKRVRGREKNEEKGHEEEGEEEKKGVKGWIEKKIQSNLSLLFSCKNCSTLSLSLSLSHILLLQQSLACSTCFFFAGHCAQCKVAVSAVAQLLLPVAHAAKAKGAPGKASSNTHNTHTDISSEIGETEEGRNGNGDEEREREREREKRMRQHFHSRRVQMAALSFPFSLSTHFDHLHSFLSLLTVSKCSLLFFVPL